MMSDDHTALLPLRKEAEVPPAGGEQSVGGAGGGGGCSPLLGSNAVQLMGTGPDLHPEQHSSTPTQKGQWKAAHGGKGQNLSGGLQDRGRAPLCPLPRS